MRKDRWVRHIKQQQTIYSCAICPTKGRSGEMNGLRTIGKPKGKVDVIPGSGGETITVHVGQVLVCSPKCEREAYKRGLAIKPKVPRKRKPKVPPEFVLEE